MKLHIPVGSVTHTAASVAQAIQLDSADRVASIDVPEEQSLAWARHGLKAAAPAFDTSGKP
jgi:hypothetical protein